MSIKTGIMGPHSVGAPGPDPNPRLVLSEIKIKTLAEELVTKIEIFIELEFTRDQNLGVDVDGNKLVIN